MKKYILEFTTFVCGAIGMIIELVAARILSPYLGSSNLVWTCIIGMMLAFMSIGYFVGGKISDKCPNIKVLSLFLLLSAVFISIIPFIEIYVIDPLSKTGINYSLMAIICSTVTFGIPSLFLATVSPFCVKLKDKELADVGKISGSMSSFSTIGSILGTFIAGFILIPLLGVKNIILILVIIICLMSFLIYDEKNIKYIIKSFITYFILIAIVLFAKEMFYKIHQDIILDTDSEYSRIWIRNLNVNGEKCYAIQVDLGIESVANDKNKLTDNYLKYYDLFNYYKPDSKNVLMIGGAAYTYPSYFLNQYSNKNIDVVEIDDKMTQLASQYFKLDKNNPRMRIYHQDGRTFLNMQNNKYDSILVDAFKGTNAPFQLTTSEAMLNAKNMLNDGGVVITNIISSISGKDSEFIQYEYSTYKKVFDDVKLFRVQENIDDEERQNLILIGTKGNIIENEQNQELYKSLLKNEIRNFNSSKKAVNDDLCPIGV